MQQIIFCTYPDKNLAITIAKQLINHKLAACVNIIPNVISVYQWQDKLESTAEYLLLIKTREDKFKAIERQIKQHHPYKLPEIIAFTIDAGLPEYLKWIDTCLTVK